MTICRAVHNKDNPYTMIHTSIAIDKRISAKATGIWMYAFSRPDDWKFYVSDIVNQFTDGRESISSGLKELEKFGYLEKHQPRVKGAFAPWEWIFHEVSQKPELEAEPPKKTGGFKKRVPQTGLPVPSKTVSSNPALPITEENLVLKEPTNVSVGSFFPCLDNFDMPESLKVKLTKDYGEGEIEKAIEVYKESNSHIPKPYGFLKKAIEEDWTVSVPKAEEAVSGDNKAFALKFTSDATSVKFQSGICLDILHEYVTFSHGCWTQTIEYKNMKFKEMFEALYIKSHSKE